MEAVVVLHSVVRWVVIVLAVLALVRAYRGWLRNLEYTHVDRRVGVFFSSAMDIQLLLGLILWIFGDWGIKAFDLAEGLEGAQKIAALFFAVEHSSAMVIAVVLVHIGTIVARRTENAKLKHQLTALFFSIAVLLVLVAIPWTQRPLLPGF